MKTIDILRWYFAIFPGIDYSLFKEVLMRNECDSHLGNVHPDSTNQLKMEFKLVFPPFIWHIDLKQALTTNPEDTLKYQGLPF